MQFSVHKLHTYCQLVVFTIHSNKDIGNKCHLIRTENILSVRFIWLQ